MPVTVARLISPGVFHSPTAPKLELFGQVMTNELLKKLLFLSLPVLVISLMPGCGGSDALTSPTAVKLRALGNFYLEYALGNGNTGPANEKAFKKHLRNAPDFNLKNYGLDPNNIDSAFVSERDGEPFVILYGVKISEISPTAAPLIAYEKTGQNGKRLVGFANAKVEEVDEARLEALMAPPP